MVTLDIVNKIKTLVEGIILVSQQIEYETKVNNPIHANFYRDLYALLESELGIEVESWIFGSNLLSRKVIADVDGVLKYYVNTSIKDGKMEGASPNAVPIVANAIDIKALASHFEKMNARYGRSVSATGSVIQVDEMTKLVQASDDAMKATAEAHAAERKQKLVEAIKSGLSPQEAASAEINPVFLKAQEAVKEETAKLKSQKAEKEKEKK